MELPKFNFFTRTVLFVSWVSRLIRCCHVRNFRRSRELNLVMVLHSVHRQPPVYHRQFDFYSHNTAWIHDNSQPANSVLSPIYRFICGKYLTTTLKLACLFNAVGRVNDHLYISINIHTLYAYL
jgi:hypothetical protein